MIKVTVPVEAGNRAIRDGSLPKVIADAIERLKPEASYFFAEGGIRTCLFVVDVKDASEIPVIAEPFFTQLDAAVALTPVMNAEDLKKGLGQIARK
jgi:hypothetical protein